MQPTASADQNESPPSGTADEPPPRGPLTNWAWTTFVVLFAMNLLDYIDRWVLSAVLPSIQKEFTLSNESAGTFNLWFLLCYSLVSPFMGWAGDRTKRTRLLFVGVGLWSLATVGTGLARSSTEIFIARALLGVGEATYGVIAPTMLMDLFARRSRSRVLSLFYLAMPIGGAIGMALGGYIAAHHGWRLAFFIAGAPGLIAAFSALLLPEPIRGASEGLDAEQLKAHARKGHSRQEYLDLLVNSSYTYSVFGMTAYTFAIGGFAYWMPTFLSVTRQIPHDRATATLGVVTALAAIVGMSLGGILSDALARTRPRWLFILPGLAMLGSIPFVIMGLLGRSETVIFSGIFLAEMLMFINTGPCNAIIANVVSPNLRATAYAVAIFTVHILGDVWSPKLMGWVADTFGDADTMSTAFGQLFTAIGAVPTETPGRAPENLTAGMLVVVPALLVSGTVLLAGARHLPREMARMSARLRASLAAPPPPGSGPGDQLSSPGGLG